MRQTHPSQRSSLAFPRLWQAIGWLLVAVVSGLTLMPKPPQPPLITSDKIHHLLAYTGLMLWFAQAFGSRVVWMIFLVGLGIALEFLQGWIGYRQFEYGDMLANSLGVGCGLALSATALGRLVGWLDRALAQRSSD